MSSFNGLTLSNLADYQTYTEKPSGGYSNSPKYSSFYESEHEKAPNDSFEPYAEQIDWESKYYELLESRESKDHQLQETLDSLAGIVNRLESEILTLRADRKKLTQQIDILERENHELKQNRPSTREVSDLRGMLKFEREKFQEELIELSAQLEKLQEELNVVKEKKAKQGMMQKKVRPTQIELTHETFARHLEEKERKIQV